MLILPLLPIVIASAATAHRLGPLALGGGLVITFVGVGLFVATIGFGIDSIGAPDLGRQLESRWRLAQETGAGEPYVYSPQAKGVRRLRNVALGYIAASGAPDAAALASAASFVALPYAFQSDAPISSADPTAISPTPIGPNAGRNAIDGDDDGYVDVSGCA